MNLTLGFSPCPNDTFIFDALVNKKIDTEGLELQPVLEDVQTLNEWALQGRLDITKISYGVLPLLLDRYLVLNAGGGDDDISDGGLLGFRGLGHRGCG